MTQTTLLDRAIVRLSGEDVRGFVQGLVTSDVLRIVHLKCTSQRTSGASEPAGNRAPGRDKRSSHGIALTRNAGGRIAAGFAVALDGMQRRLDELGVHRHVHRRDERQAVFRRLEAGDERSRQHGFACAT